MNRRETIKALAGLAATAFTPPLLTSCDDPTLEELNEKVFPETVIEYSLDELPNEAKILKGATIESSFNYEDLLTIDPKHIDEYTQDLIGKNLRTNATGLTLAHAFGTWRKYMEIRSEFNTQSGNWWALGSSQSVDLKAPERLGFKPRYNHPPVSGRIFEYRVDNFNLSTGRGAIILGRMYAREFIGTLSVYENGKLANRKHSLLVGNTGYRNMVYLARAGNQSRGYDLYRNGSLTTYHFGIAAGQLDPYVSPFPDLYVEALQARFKHGNNIYTQAYDDWLLRELIFTHVFGDIRKLTAPDRPLYTAGLITGSTEGISRKVRVVENPVIA